MSKPIILARRRTESSNDTTVSKFVLAAQRTVGPYVEWGFPERFNYVPPPVYFCIRALVLSPEQVHHLSPYTLRYDPPSSDSDFDIIKALIPTYKDPRFTISRVDPRLWATLIQLYSTSLPKSFESYPIPLSDIYLPLLQQIPSTPDFTLITILELPDCEELTDSSISELRHLSSLCALEASGTTLTDYGVSALSKTVGWYDGDRRRGPWSLRILRLRSCRGITHKVFHHIKSFPLLAVLDLRGTECSTSSFIHPWSVSSDPGLYHPTPLRTSLELLSSLGLPSCKFFPSSSVFSLYIDTVEYSHPKRSKSKGESHSSALTGEGRSRETDVGPENTAITLLPRKKDSKDNVLLAQVAPEQLPSRRSRRRHLRGVPTGMCLISAWKMPQIDVKQQVMRTSRISMILMSSVLLMKVPRALMDYPIRKMISRLIIKKVITTFTFQHTLQTQISVIFILQVQRYHNKQLRNCFQ
ncbi:uncharacterized protein BT62DRAFT_6984 [Guyanagaster necrorhizus]|uniref:Uncharacterized protein n=1 Tax=Guyanagaster necrorhizus TaxID=856835 RepID=A0A9P8AYI1_9AGAR|nr:uncharacterized protein BT62DRAFT_6984 [Guyanagaster necrorhizus MCA 3950]KAG7452525.1 hypothetical protein BT62DRAFT_6984 [Guyanagaster necrorhizus MCA 3950]